MDTPGFSEDGILSGCRKNDRRSQELLYRHFAKKMYAICLSYAGERPLAQDMLQEAFVKVFNNINGFTNEGSLEGWIRRIVTNTAIDYVRKRQRGMNFTEMEAVDSSLHAHNPALGIMGFNELMKHVGRLPDGARLIFNMHALDGFTHREIAEKLAITEGTSKSQFNRARKLLINFIGNLNLL
jgi:RNA polymerase sigma factor (sigma-70 family)